MRTSLLRQNLSTALVYLGVATAIVFFAFAFLSLDNPLMMAVLLTSGPAVGGVIAAVGYLFENSERSRAAQEQAAADTRASTKATLSLVQELRAQSNHPSL